MTIQTLINELVSGYIESKYDKKYLKEKITEILEFVIPEIAAIVKGKKGLEKTLLQLLWRRNKILFF